MIVYHSPSALHDDFVRFLEDIIEELTIKGDYMVLRDFNIDFMVDSFYTKKLQSLMLSLGMKQYVNKPTRITKDSQTIIDLLFANNKVQLQIIHEPKITDHAWLKIVLHLNKIESKFREFNARDYSKFSIDEFISLVENRIGQDQDLEVNRRAKKFVEALDIIAPKKKKAKRLYCTHNYKVVTCIL